MTPAFLIFLLAGWIVTSAPQYLSISNAHIWLGRVAMIALFAMIEILIYVADRRGSDNNSKQ